MIMKYGKFIIKNKIQTIDILVERAIRKKEIKDYFYQILKVIY